MKYHVIEGVECFYALSEDEAMEDGNPIIATCDSEDTAKLISKALAEYVHEQNTIDSMADDEDYCPFCKSTYNINDGHRCW